MRMTTRTLPQNRKFSAIVDDVAASVFVAPWQPSWAREVWRRFFLKLYVYEARLEAYGAGQPDPFPVRPVPSSELDDRQMSGLIECALWFAAERLNLILQ
jgi:hypothetical protein